MFSNTFTQEDVYTTTAQPLVDSLFEGRNCMLFSYGPTNSGKTYTIEGDDANPGILPRVLDEVFTRSKDIEQNTPGTSVFIWATYLEVYNENVYAPSPPIYLLFVGIRLLAQTGTIFSAPTPTIASP